jgi:hypothetical protein
MSGPNPTPTSYVVLGLRWHRVAADFWAETAASPP